MERTDEMARPRRRFGAPATASLVAAIAVTWAYERARFGARPTIAELHVLGGLSWDALRLGEPWRLPAASLLHASWRHVLEDAAAVAAVGVVLERRTSSPAVAATLALGCIGASVGALVQLPGGLTIGASGLVFALLGLGATLPGRGVRVVAAVLLVAGLVAGAAALLTASPGHAEVTSLGSHIGGAVAGLLVGALARS
ncbi:MAG: Rhomboid family, partial [Thermoleophilia bacterium]|nr:Rhomboid family [Thermoleophilia bacterium]